MPPDLAADEKKITQGQGDTEEQFAGSRTGENSDEDEPLLDAMRQPVVPVPEVPEPQEFDGARKADSYQENQLIDEDAQAEQYRQFLLRQ